MACPLCSCENRRPVVCRPAVRVRSVMGAFRDGTCSMPPFIVRRHAVCNVCTKFETQKKGSVLVKMLSFPRELKHILFPLRCTSLLPIAHRSRAARHMLQAALSPLLVALEKLPLLLLTITMLGNSPRRRASTASLLPACQHSWEGAGRPAGPSGLRNCVARQRIYVRLCRHESQTNHSTAIIRVVFQRVAEVMNAGLGEVLL
eukprot:3909956-Rhodomonas_salina.1